MGLAASQSGSAAMENATWGVTTTSNVSANPFSLEMNGNGASQAGSANLFLSMMGMLQPITAEEAKEDTIDDEDQEEEIQDEDSNDYSGTFTMPTFQEKPTKRLNTRYLKSEDLETLKEEDPFMYYSIPEVRRAVFAGRDVDLTTAAPVVKRRSAISYESADLPDLDLLQEAYDEMDESSSDDESFMDMIFSSMQHRQ